MVRILYSYNKRGFEAEFWHREIAAASTASHTFIPFNHGEYIDPSRTLRAQALDDLFFAKDRDLMRLYEAFERRLAEESADAVIVDNAMPYHPDYLRGLTVYKVLRTSDGPLTAYERDFAYLHAYDHVLYHSPAYSPELDMASKLAYCGAKRADFWPLALFDAQFDPSRSGSSLVRQPRDIDVIFVGSLFVNKMPLLAAVKKAFGRRFVLRGLTSWKRNAYFNARFGFPGWVTPIRFNEYVSLYQRAKIGINVHNRGDYTVGSYRLFELAGNGVMQISDGGRYLESFYEIGKEIVPYRDTDDLIATIHHFLHHDDEREQVAISANERVLRDHRIATRLEQAGEIIARGIAEKKAQGSGEHDR